MRADRVAAPRSPSLLPTTSAWSRHPSRRGPRHIHQVYRRRPVHRTHPRCRPTPVHGRAATPVCSTCSNASTARCAKCSTTTLTAAFATVDAPAATLDLKCATPSTARVTLCAGPTALVLGGQGHASPGGTIRLFRSTSARHLPARRPRCHRRRPRRHWCRRRRIRQSPILRHSSRPICYPPLDLPSSAVDKTDPRMESARSPRNTRMLK